MYGIAKYIEVFFKGYYFSPTFWANDNNTGLISIPLQAAGAECIVYTTFIIANSNAAAQTVVITDKIGNVPLFTYTLLPNTSVSISEFGHVINSNQVAISSNNTAINFSLCYQYLTKLQPKTKHWTEA